MNLNLDFSIIYITVSSLDEGRKIARSLLEKNLIACANISSSITSIFKWEGSIKEAEECIMICKARTEDFEKIDFLVKSLHSYTCPCVISIPIEDGNKSFFEWIEKETEFSS
jgi:periplasmic divalent cation tolerance protein